METLAYYLMRHVSFRVSIKYDAWRSGILPQHTRASGHDHSGLTCSQTTYSPQVNTSSSKPSLHSVRTRRRNIVGWPTRDSFLEFIDLHHCS